MRKYEKYLLILPCVTVSSCIPEQNNSTKVVKEKGLYDEIIEEGFVFENPQHAKFFCDVVEIEFGIYQKQYFFDYLKKLKKTYHRMI